MQPKFEWTISDRNQVQSKPKLHWSPDGLAPRFAQLSALTAVNCCREAAADPKTAALGKAVSAPGRGNQAPAAETEEAWRMLD